MDKTLVLVQIILKEKERLLKTEKTTEAERRLEELDACLNKLLRKEK